MCLLCKQRLVCCALCRIQLKLCLYWVFLRTFFSCELWFSLNDFISISYIAVLRSNPCTPTGERERQTVSLAVFYGLWKAFADQECAFSIFSPHSNSNVCFVILISDTRSWRVPETCLWNTSEWQAFPYTVLLPEWKVMGYYSFTLQSSRGVD